MQKVYKYKLETQEFQVLLFPLGSKILSAMVQKDDIVIYALVNPFEEKREEFAFQVYGTGYDITSCLDNFKFLNTIYFEKLGLVFHIFYR